MMKNDLKKADNRIFESRNNFDLYDQRIDEERQKLKNIDQMKENLTDFNKTMNNCLGLLLYVKGKQNSYKYNEMYNKNNLNYSKMISILEEEEHTCNRNINRFLEQNRNDYKEKKR